MRKAELSFREIGLIAGTRGILGAGLGLLLADRIGRTQRKRVGWSLFVTGALSTIPLLFHVMKKRNAEAKSDSLVSI